VHVSYPRLQNPRCAHWITTHNDRHLVAMRLVRFVDKRAARRTTAVSARIDAVPNQSCLSTPPNT